MRHPIPDAALDGRIAIVGISGSGKSTTAKGGVERLLGQGRRVCVVDLLDGWWGLRVKRDGHTPAFPVAIFGGQHGDLPLTEHAGDLIGQAVAQSEGSSIVCLSELDGDAPRRRFALAFFNALHRTNRAPLHLVIDEADFYAPQNPVKEGPGPLLLNRVKEIAARGRMRGFRCWPITQRPAKLHKDVLSQADTLIAMQLTSSQDRAAIEGWIGDQGDKAVGKAILASLPGLKLGQGVLWAPKLGILEATHFPLPATYDSSRTPEHGADMASVELKPIDLGALREKMGKVEAETKANDPRELRREIARLKGQLAERVDIKVNSAPSEEALLAARQEGFRDGCSAALLRETGTLGELQRMAQIVRSKFEGALATMGDVDEFIAKATAFAEGERQALPARAVPRKPAHNSSTLRPTPVSVLAAPRKSPLPTKHNSSTPSDGLTRPQQRILDGLAWLETMRIPSADRTRVAWLADASPKSSSFMNNLGTLSTNGLIRYPRRGEVELTDAGRSAANPPDAPLTTAELHACFSAKLPRPQWAIVEQLVAAHPEMLNREILAGRAGASPTSSSFMNNLGTLRGLGLVDYPERGFVTATDICFVG